MIRFLNFSKFLKIYKMSKKNKNIIILDFYFHNILFFYKKDFLYIYFMARSIMFDWKNTSMYDDDVVDDVGDVDDVDDVEFSNSSRKRKRGNFEIEVAEILCSLGTPNNSPNNSPNNPTQILKTKPLTRNSLTRKHFTRKKVIHHIENGLDSYDVSLWINENTGLVRLYDHFGEDGWESHVIPAAQYYFPHRFGPNCTKQYMKGLYDRIRSGDERIQNKVPDKLRDYAQKIWEHNKENGSWPHQIENREKWDNKLFKFNSSSFWMEF